MLTLLQHQQQSVYITVENDDLVLNFNKPLVILPDYPLTIPVNCLFMKPFTRKIDDNVRVTSIGNLDNVLKISSELVYLFETSMTVHIADVDFFLYDEVAFKPVQFKFENGHNWSSLPFSLNTRQYLELIVKWLGGQMIKAHWSTKYGQAVTRHTLFNYTLQEEEFFEKCSEQGDDYLKYVRNNHAAHLYFVAAMPAQYGDGTIQKFFNGNNIAWRTDVLEVRETALMETIGFNINESAVWFDPDGVTSGRGTYMMNWYNAYTREISLLNENLSSHLKSKRSVTMLLTKIPSLKELESIINLTRTLGLIYLKSISFQNCPRFFGWLKTKIDVEVIEQRVLANNIMHKPFLLIEFVSYNDQCKTMLKDHCSSTLLFWPEVDIDGVCESVEEWYKRKVEDVETSVNNITNVKRSKNE
jgi:hypothetical protein